MHFTYSINGYDDIDIPRLNEQGLDGHNLSVKPAISKRDKRLVRVQERSRHDALERVRNYCRVEPDVLTRERRFHEVDQGSNYGIFQRAGLFLRQSRMVRASFEYPRTVLLNSDHRLEDMPEM